MAHAAHRLSEDEYLARERESATKHEYVAGIAYAMAGATPRHNLVAMNVGGALREQLRARPCVVLGSDQRVRVEETDGYFYPDLLVVCDGARTHRKDPHAIVNPTVIVEVSSRSTRGYDRDAKFAHYRRIASLRDYVLVSGTEKRVEHYRLTDQGWLLVDLGAADTLELASVGAQLTVAEIYEKWDLLPSELPAPPE